MLIDSWTSHALSYPNPRRPKPRNDGAAEVIVGPDIGGRGFSRQPPTRREQGDRSARRQVAAEERPCAVRQMRMTPSVVFSARVRCPKNGHEIPTFAA